MIDDSPNFIARHCANLRAVAGHLPIGGELTMLLTKSADLIDRMREGAKAERERLERENANLRAALLEQGDELKRLREVIALHEQVSSQEVSRG